MKKRKRRVANGPGGRRIEAWIENGSVDVVFQVGPDRALVHLSANNAESLGKILLDLAGDVRAALEKRGGNE